MSLRKTILIPTLVAAAMAVGALSAPAATAAGIDPCRAAVSSSRCLGPAGVQGHDPNTLTGITANAKNGPYGPWGNVPPIGR